MAGGFHIYFEAARALWDMSTRRLTTMSREAKSGAERRAAQLTLNLKREFVTPGEFGDERSSLTKLASALLEDRQFTMEMALQLTPKKARRSAATVVQSGVGNRKPRHTMMWIAITAGVLLLVMDVLATAGVPIPTPIGEILDRVTGEDESPVVPGPQSSRPGGHRARGLVIGEGTDAIPNVETKADREPDGMPAHARTPTRGRAQDTAARRAPIAGTAAPTQGKEAHQAQGKEAHQAQGKEAHQARGRAEHQPTLRGNEKEAPTSQGKAKGLGKNGKGNPGGPDRD